MGSLPFAVQREQGIPESLIRLYLHVSRRDATSATSWWTMSGSTTRAIGTLWTLFGLPSLQ